MQQKSFIAITCLLLYCQLVCAQTGHSTLKGNVRDSSNGELLELATLSLIRLKDTIESRQAVSGKKGFTFTRVPAGSYWLISSYLGYRNDTIQLLIKPDSTYSFDILLARAPANMLEVVVRRTIPPVIIRNDTLVFNANAIKTQPNATVEELLKRIPGMKVDQDGMATLHGKKIEKIYIDGKEFFLNDPRIATRNLTADMVAAVEIFDNQSEKARFSGIKEANVNKAINLRLKSDRKRGIFGNATLGAGTEKLVSGAATTTLFSDAHWFFASLTGNYADNLNEQTGLLQSSLMPALNYRSSLSKKSTVVFNYSGAGNRRKTGISTVRQTMTGDSSVFQNKQSFNSQEDNSQRLDGNIISNLDSFHSITYSPQVSWSKTDHSVEDSSVVQAEKPTGSSLLSKGRTMSSMSKKEQVQNHSITFRKRFRKAGRTLFLSLTERYRESRENGHFLSVLHTITGNSPLEPKKIDQVYDQLVYDNLLAAGFSYTEPLTKRHVLDIGYNFAGSSNTSSRNAFLPDPLTGKYDVADTSATNRLRNRIFQNHIQLGYNYLGKQLQFQLGLMIFRNILENRTGRSSSPEIRQSITNWSPRASALFQLASQKTLQVQYSGISSMPTPEMLQPITNVSDPYLILKGNPFLKQQFQHTVNLNYNAAGTNFNSLSIQLNADYTSNRIVQASTILQGGIQELQYVNVNGNYAVEGALQFGFALDPSNNGGGQLSSNISWSRDASLLNGDRNILKNLIAEQAVSFNYHHGDKFFALMTAGLSFNKSTYSLSRELNTGFLSQHYSANLSAAMPFGVFIATDLTLQHNSKQGSIPGNTLTLWNAAVYRPFLKNNKAEIRLTASDLLNNNSGFTRTVGEQYIETRKSYVMRRYFLLSIRYNLRTPL